MLIDLIFYTLVVVLVVDLVKWFWTQYGPDNE